MSMGVTEETFKEKLADKVVVIVGVGGTGCSVLQQLARFSFKEIHIYDPDFVEKNNVERQILFTERDIGKTKVGCASHALGEIFPVIPHHNEVTDEYFNSGTVGSAVFKRAHIIIDCTDNVTTRLLLESFSEKHSIPLLYTGAVGDVGSVLFISPGGKKLSKLLAGKQGESCCRVGVLPSVLGMVGSIATQLVLDYFVKGKCSEDLFRINLSQFSLQVLKV